MVIFFILVVLLSLCSVSVGNACNQEFLDNVDFPGSDITSMYSPSVDHCQQLCTQHPSCLFFTFIHPDWTRDNRQFFCYLKSTPSGQPASQTPLQGVTSGFSLKPCNPDPRPCFSQVYENVDFPGADYKAFFTADPHECQRACTQDPGCQFFTFLTGDFPATKFRYKCHLKFSCYIPRTPIVERKAGVISGFSPKLQFTQQFDTACESELFPNIDIPGSDLLSLKAASAEHCQVLCSAHPQCSYFSFDRNSFTCFLKNNPNEMVTKAKEGITSGIPARFCRLDDNWAKQIFEGVDFKGSDIRYELMDDADVCLNKCTEDPNCQFYTYVNENFSDPVYWRRCYLKRVITMPAPPKVTKLDKVISGFTLRSCGTSV